MVAAADGVPVEASDQIFRHEFFYLESEREEIREKNAAIAEGSAKK